MDNKVVALALDVSGEVDFAQRTGSNVLNWPIKKAMKAFKQVMVAVDGCDQYQLCGAGFASKSCYKTWYKKAYMAILHFMVIYAFFAWNMHNLKWREEGE